MSSHPTVVPSSRRVVGQSVMICGNLWYEDDSPHLVLEVAYIRIICISSGTGKVGENGQSSLGVSTRFLWIRPSVPPPGNWRVGIANDWVTDRSSQNIRRWLYVQSSHGKGG